MRVIWHFNFGYASALEATRPVLHTTAPTSDSDCGHPRDDRVSRKSIGYAIEKDQKTPVLDGRILAEQDSFIPESLGINLPLPP